MRHCPHCGSSDFRAVSFKEFRCGDCGFNFFVNSAAAVVAIIRDGEGRVLFTRRARNPFEGWLDLPGGFVDPGESAETALAREVEEELSVKVVGSRYLCSFPNEYIFSGYKVRTTDLAFECEVETMPTKCSDDVAEIEWRRAEEINIDEIPFDSIKRIAARVKEEALRQ